MDSFPVRRKTGNVTSVKKRVVSFFGQCDNFSGGLTLVCTELERLESELIRIRSAERNASLTAVQKEALVSAEVQMVMAIKDHRSFGHDGKACFGE